MVFSWEPRENIGEGCDDLVAHVERTAALGPNPAVGTEVNNHFIHFSLNLTVSKWLAPEAWLSVYIHVLLVKFLMR